MLYRIQLVWEGFELTTLVVICTEVIGGSLTSYKSNHYIIIIIILLLQLRAPEEAESYI
jgi:hypothetical protein